ncbi:galactose-1-phosphate uridylyltransferase [Candidatus Woesearchaeota archaeon]|nr:galactose-1-phosphate uridylyltransferase [Candidatus Woesearchaeota archaeon]
MEIRKDYVLDRYVVIAAARKKRHKQFKKEAQEKVGTCFFCPGNESMTPPEIGRIGTARKWKMRWFPNKFPAVAEEGQIEFKTDNKFYTFASAYGRQEVVVETSDHSKQLWDLGEDEIKQVLGVYINRIKELNKVNGVKYVCIFKNHGKDAGTSIVHTHTQVIAYNKIPNLIKEEVEASKKFDNCPYCDIILSEKDSDRRAFENDNFVAFAPYASRYNYELWIFSKQHKKSLVEFNEDELKDLAMILRQILFRLKELNISYNFQIHNAPDGEDLHFHIEVCPRMAVWGGFELLTNDVINSVPPEDAAKFYRGE